MKICSKCGHQNDDRSEFCSGCLNPLAEVPNDSVKTPNEFNANADSSRTQTNVHHYSAGASSRQTNYARTGNAYGTGVSAKGSLWDESNPLWYKIAKFILKLNAILATIEGVIFFFVYISNGELFWALLFLLVYPLVFWVACAWGMLLLQHFRNVANIKTMMETGYSSSGNNNPVIHVDELPKL